MDITFWESYRYIDPLACPSSSLLPAVLCTSQSRVIPNSLRRIRLPCCPHKISADDNIEASMAGTATSASCIFTAATSISAHRQCTRDSSRLSALIRSPVTSRSGTLFLRSESRRSEIFAHVLFRKPVPIRAVDCSASVGEACSPPFDALLFDCDGVLVDTERDGHRVSFNQAFKEVSLPCPPHYCLLPLETEDVSTSKLFRNVATVSPVGFLSLA